jgi:hypothetical protein
MRFSAWANSRSDIAMDFPPFIAQMSNPAGQRRFDTAYVRPAESIALTQFRWSMRAIQDKGRFTARSYYVSTSGPMIGRIDDRPKAVEAENRRRSSTKPSA